MSGRKTLELAKPFRRKLSLLILLYSESKRVKLQRGASLKINDNRLLLADKPRFVGRMRQHSKDLDANNIEYVELKQEKMVGSLSLVTETKTLKTHKHCLVFNRFCSQLRM